MTSSEWATKAPGLFIPQPFAAGDATHQKQFKDILNSIDGSDVNFIEGFTQAFESPSSQGGRYISRKELNAIGHLASANWFKRMCGGIFTFDANLAARINGYPKYAVLDYLDGLNYYRVISLVDNNLVDFRGLEPNTAQAQAGVVSGSVDGINWAFCERGFVADRPADSETDLVATVTPFSTSDSGTILLLKSFKAKKSGILTVEGIPNYTPTGDYSQTGQSTIGGFALVAKANPSVGPWDTQFTQFYTTGYWGPLQKDGIRYDSTGISMFSVEQNTNYAIYIIATKMTMNGELKVVIG